MSSLFGNTNNTGGGLFGGTKPSGGLFGSTASKPMSGGLFGSSNPTQGQPASSGGGLFGSTSSTSKFGGGSTSGGLFGSSSSTSTAFGSKGGLFGNSSGGSTMASSTTSGGLFGSKPSTGGGLFGAKPAASSGGGIFGGSSKPSGGLFGSSGGGMSSQPKTSFFPSSFSSQPAGQSAFGSTNQADLQNGTASINFTGIKDKDHGGDAKSLITLTSITADPSYCQISIEELRMADYALKKQGKVNFPIGAQPGQQTNTSAFGGSFGASSAARPTGTGLFGSSSTSQPKTGGLFSSSTSSTQASGGGGSLFGSKPATGLFGGGGAASSSLKPSGGLFGSSSTPSFGASAKPAGTGLFGSTLVKPGTSALFGGASKPAFGSSSAFGGGTSSFGGGTSAFGGSGSLFSKPGGTAFGGATAQVAAQPTQQQAEASYIQALSTLSEDPYGTNDMQEAFKLTSIDTEKQIVLNKIVDQILLYSGTKTSGGKESIYDESNIIGTSNSYLTGPISLKLNRRDTREEFSGSFKKDNIFSRKSRDNAYYENEARQRMIEHNRARQNEDYLLHNTTKYIREKNKSNEEQAQNQLSNETLFEREKSSGPLFSQSKNTEIIHELSGPNIVKIKISVFIDEDEEILLLSIDKTRKVSNLRDLVINKLKTKYPGIADRSTLIQIVHRSRILNLDNVLEDSGVQNGMKFDMLVQEQQITRTETAKPDDESTRRKKNQENDPTSLLAPLEKLPIMRRKNYSLHPDLIEMARMNEYELTKIENLFIENEHGQVMWEGKTDVRGINFDELVIIDKFSATVYPEHIEKLNMKPEIGKGLNKPAIIKLYNIYPPQKNNETLKKRFEESLKNKTSTLDDAEFIDYKPDSGILTFRVAHFTKYDFSNVDDNEEESQQEENEESENDQPARMNILAHKSQEKERFSFGIHEGKYNQGASTPVTFEDGEPVDYRNHEIESGDDMEIERNPRHTVNLLSSQLDNICEESDSKASSVIMHEEDESMEVIQKKEHKIHFGEIVEKQFEDEALEEGEDEIEEQPYYQEEYIPSIDDIKAKIKLQKQKIEDSIKTINDQRLQSRKSIRS